MQQINSFYGDGPFPLVDGDGTRMFGIPTDTGLPFSAATLPSRHMSSVLRSRGANLAPGRSTLSTVLSMRTRQPLVQAACKENELLTYRDNDSYITFPGASPYLGKLVTWNDCLEKARSDDNILFFREFPASGSPRHSTAMVFGTTAPVDRDDLATVSACIVDATWARVTLNASRADSFNQMDYILNDHYNHTMPRSEIIHMPSSWTDRVGTAVLNSSAILERRLRNIYPEQLFAFILSNADYEYLGSGVALDADEPCCGRNGQDALGTYLDKTRVWSQYLAISLDVNAGWSDPSTLTYQLVTQYQQGYGYDASDITVQLSLVVVGVYCVFVTAHIFMLLLTGYCGTSWDSISELLMLGLLSRKPTHLDCVSVGVETLKTFREPVSVRVNDVGAVELVFEDEPGGIVGRTAGVEKNKSY
jgi:hypothetical protein